MKAVITLILVLAFYDATATEIRVSKMKITQGYTDRFDLQTSFDEKVVLDCQSFVQGLLFGPVGESGIMLEEWECDELKNDMRKSLQRFKKHCLVVDFDRGVLETQEVCP